MGCAPSRIVQRAWLDNWPGHSSHSGARSISRQCPPNCACPVNRQWCDCSPISSNGQQHRFDAALIGAGWHRFGDQCRTDATAAHEVIKTLGAGWLPAATVTVLVPQVVTACEFCYQEALRPDGTWTRTEGTISISAGQLDTLV